MGIVNIVLNDFGERVDQDLAPLKVHRPSYTRPNGRDSPLRHVSTKRVTIVAIAPSSEQNNMRSKLRPRRLTRGGEAHVRASVECENCESAARRTTFRRSH